MKKFIYMTVAALVMLTTLSCEKEKLSPKDNPSSTESSVEKVDMVFSAVTSGTEKTTITDETVAIWSETDVIKVFTDKDTQGSPCAISDGAGTTSATFSGQCAKEGPWTAVCPADKATGFNNGTVTLTMPENQTYALNTFASGALPCVAYSDKESFFFDNSFGVLKLRLQLAAGRTGSVKSITLTDKAGAKLNGTFTVNPSLSPVATKGGADGTSSITLDCVNGVELSTSTATEFWFVVPEGAFASGLDVKVTSTNDIEEVFSTTLPNKITAGKIKVMPISEIVLKPASIGRGTATRKEGTGEVEIEWIQLWENGPQFAEYNLGATAVGGVGGMFCWGGHEAGSRSSSHAQYDIQQSSDDAATLIWGPDWCIPTRDEMQYLIDNCTMVWKRANESGYGVEGCFVTGKGDYSGNSLFFPVTRYDYYDGYSAAYWTSTPQSGSAHLCNQFRIWSSYPVPGSYIYGESDYDLVGIRPIYKKAPVISGEAERTGGENVKWVMMWPGGPKWAEYNVGADSELEYGGYYFWGISVNQVDRPGVQTYSQSTNSIQGTNEDTAKNLWGDNWQMPTEEDLNGLITKCDVEVVSNYNNSGMSGRLYKGRGACAGNTLFLPESGYCDMMGNVGSRNSVGYYWSATPHGSDKSGELYISYSSTSIDHSARYIGNSVRAILAE
ncbi:MAG: hypothetical protein MJ003_07450 [Paludibacteraceae bacterium]|nr:hypothetical protein [Paludibacteraceae bacterium]